MRDANVEGLLELDDVAGSQSTTTNGPEQEQEPAPLTGVDRLLRQREAWFELMREAELMSADETDETDETDGGVDDECMRDISQGRSCTKWDDRAKGRNGLKTGDMLFFSDNKIKSKMQRFFSGKLVTHVGTVVWNKWDKIENRFVYVTAWEPDAILTLMEVSNHKNRDIETTMFPTTASRTVTCIRSCNTNRRARASSFGR